MRQNQECPFIEQSDSRCAEQLKLGQLDDAFRLCVSYPAKCPIYHELRGRQLSNGQRREQAVTAGV